MPNTHTTLKSLFDDVADAIREKDGTSASIVADTFPTKIREIPAAPSWDGTIVDYVPPLVNKGQIITMNLGNTGSYDIGLGTNSYRVLDCNGTDAFVVAMYEANNSQMYNATSKTTTIGGRTVQKYNGSDLDIYLNQTWYNSLNATAEAAIIPTEISQGSYLYSDTPNDHRQSTSTYQYEYNWSGEGVDDENANYEGEEYIGSRNVFALDMKDIFDYHGNSYIRSNDLMQLFYNQNNPSTKTNPWLRSAYAGSSGRAWQVFSSYGGLNYNNVNISYAARPAFHIDLSKVSWSIAN